MKNCTKGFPQSKSDMQSQAIAEPNTPDLLWQVTEGTVDDGVYGLAKQKLKLDAAVLQGITAGHQMSESTKDVAQMGQLLQALVAGNTDTQ